MAGPIMKQLQCAIEKDICLQEKDWELLRLPCSVSNFPEKKNRKFCVTVFTLLKRQEKYTNRPLSIRLHSLPSENVLKIIILRTSRKKAKITAKIKRGADGML